jgi:rhodanese-related sulfurtransferase
MSRGALLLLLEYGAAQGAPLVTLIDVRRHDERALYGSIRGSVHLPVEQLPKVGFGVDGLGFKV